MDQPRPEQDSPAPFRFRAQLPALVAGLAVGILLMEALLAAMALLLPEAELDRRIWEGEAHDLQLAMMLTGAWLLGGLLAGTMATAVSASRTTGCICGAMMMAPALVLGLFSGLQDWAVSVLCVTPLVGAAAGAWLAGRWSGLP